MNPKAKNEVKNQAENREVIDKKVGGPKSESLPNINWSYRIRRWTMNDEKKRITWLKKNTKKEMNVVDEMNYKIKKEKTSMR